MHGDRRRRHPRVGQAGVGQPLRPASRAGSTGSPATTAASRCGELAVVDGVGEVVGRRGRARSTPRARRRRRSPARRGARARRRRGARAPAARSARSRRSRRALDRGDGQRGVDRRAHLVHPHAPHPGRGAVRGDARWSRPRGRRRRAGVPSGPASSVPEERLARGRRRSTGSPSPTKLGQRGQQRPVVRAGLGEPQARVDDQLRRRRRRRPPRRRPGRAARRGRRARRRRRRARSLHRVAVPAPVHQDPGAAGVARRPPAIAGSASPPDTSLTTVDAGGQRRLGDRGAVGVDRQRHAVRGQPLDHRDDPAQLLLGRRPAARPAGSTRRRRRRGRRRPSRIARPCATASSTRRVAAAVGERVGGDVEDADDADPVGARRHALHRLISGPGSGSSASARVRGSALNDAAHGRGHRPGAGLADPAHRHAQVLGLDDDDDAARLEPAHQRVGDLAGQPLLHLRAAGVEVDDAGPAWTAR